jgi:DinB superfamily
MIWGNVEKKLIDNNKKRRFAHSKRLFSQNILREVSFSQKNPTFVKKSKMNPIEKRINDVATARKNYLNLIRPLTDQQAQWKPAADVWNIVEITEHLFWAEHGGIFGMWKTLLAIREGTFPRKTTSIHQNMSVEEIIDRTWQAKEVVPAIAAPRMGGPIAFWAVSLASLQDVLERFGQEMVEDDLRTLAHPHPISGDMDFQQRLAFLRFHIDRHHGQVLERLAQQA